ncbi:MAG: hypothetical protein IKM73_07960 [Acidaminococcaceae bacterium]|nr:hypothetical protein [Acidaminococcaceae bacterium]
MTEIHFRSRHESGNIFVILGMVRDEMRRQHRITEYNDLWQEVQKGDYENALRLIREKVNLIDDDGMY